MTIKNFKSVTYFNGVDHITVETGVKGITDIQVEAGKVTAYGKKGKVFTVYSSYIEMFEQLAME